MERRGWATEPVINIETRAYFYTPVIAGEIQWETVRAGAPGKLTFQVVKDSVISFHEGDRVTLRLEEGPLFSGFVFSKSRGSGNLVTVTAYDQLRYLKNRDTYAYENLTATEVIRQIAQDTGLSCGGLRSTGYRIPARVENGRTLFDIIQTALDLTAEQTGHVFVLFDEAGSLRLCHVLDLTLDTLIHSGGIGEFSYTSSIDRDTYTAVKLHRSRGDGGETVFYTAREPELVDRWGLLQYYAGLEEGEDGPTTARTLLGLYGKRTRHLRIFDAVGDYRVRAGCLLPVELALGDMDLSEFLLAERVTHRFSEGGHWMDLTLVGGEFVD